jgi:amidase
VSGFPEYLDHDALGLARLVHRGEASPAQLLEEAIARAEAVNPRLNALIAPLFERARQEVGRGEVPLDGPFAGVPFLLKDIHHAYAGAPLSSGSRALRDFVPDRHSEVVSRFLRSGLVVFGKTNLPELGLMAITESDAFGPSRNPWDTGRTPGGSSGGAAAAIAAGIVPMASANDGGGSIRIPAACCGLFGIKPSRGRIPVGPGHAEIWEGAYTDGVISRTVRDSAAALDVLSGPMPGDPYFLPPPERPFGDEVKRSPGRLRVAVDSAHPLGASVHPECREAVERTAVLLEELGHQVEEARPAVDMQALARSYLVLYFGQVAADLAWIARWKGVPVHRLEVEVETRTLGLLGNALPSPVYVEARRRWNDFARATAELHHRYDLYLTPTLAEPPVPVGTMRPAGARRLGLRVLNRLRAGKLMHALGFMDRLAAESLEKTPFTQLANLTGQPAMSVPLHRTADGVPCGVQFMARLGEEALLLRVAGQLEEARPWTGLAPMATGGAEGGF